MRLLGQIADDLAPTTALPNESILARAVQNLPEKDRAEAWERYIAARQAVREASIKLAFRALFGKGWTNKPHELKCRLLAYCILYRQTDPQFQVFYREWMATASHDELLHFQRVLGKMQETIGRRKKKTDIFNPVERVILRLWVDSNAPLFMIAAPDGAVIVQRILGEAVTVENYRKIVKRLGLPHFQRRPLKVTLRKGSQPVIEIK